MEQRGVLLRGIATFLNAGGSALVDMYDTAISVMTDVLPGEKGKFKAQLKEYEKKIEQLYCEIGKDVVLRDNTAQMSAATEAKTKLVAEYQAEIEKIKQRVQQIEEEAAAASKKKAAQHAAARVKAAPESPSPPIADAEEFAVTGLPEDSSAATEAAMEETKDVTTEAPAPEIVADAAESAEPETAAESTDNKPEEAASAELETLLKNDLLQRCSEKGIEADKRMTKAEIIALLSGR